MKRAFTLIELLIVIAIIAILALIAIPNFLEAQVRGKISRCRADMRSMGTALQAYAVDYLRVPVSSDEWNEMYGAWLSGAERLLYPLTTPVAYLTSIPVDPFADKGFTDASGPNYKAFKPFGYRAVYPYKIDTTGQMVSRTAGDWALMACKRGYSWALWTVSPKRTVINEETGTNAAPLGILIGLRPGWLYDPTNGTTSYGFVMYTNKGGVTQPQ